MLDCENVQSVLVHVGLDRLGDGILKLPFLRGLRVAFPNAKITWFAGKENTVYSGALASIVTQEIDEIIEYGGVGITPRELFSPRPLANRSFDLVIDTQRNFWTALSVRRIPHKLYISPAAKFLLASTRPSASYKLPKSMQRQLLDILELCTGNTFSSPTSIELDIPEHYQKQAQTLLPDDKVLVGFAPGSGGRPKCWPLERYISVANGIASDKVTPVFLIGPQEEEWAAEIVRAVPSAILPLQIDNGPANHKYDPLLTIALGQKLAAAVSNDSGIAHMLAVAGSPLVALYGPTVYEKFPPMTTNIRVVRAEDYGSREMSAIPIEPVASALKDLLALPDDG